MAYDPCDIILDTGTEVSPPVHHRQHAIHHVIGRIRHHQRHHVFHPRRPTADPVNLEGCEGHQGAPSGATTANIRRSDGGSSLLRTVSAAPALAALSGAGGAGIGGFGGYLVGRSSKQHKHSGHGSDGGTPVPEPSSIAMFAAALLIALAAHRWRDLRARRLASRARAALLASCPSD